MEEQRGLDPALLEHSNPAEVYHTGRILHEVALERGRQRARWGQRHDDGHQVDDWLQVLEPRLVEAHIPERPSGERRRELVEIAAIVVAEIEAMERDLSAFVEEGQGHAATGGEQ